VLAKGGFKGSESGLRCQRPQSQRESDVVAGGVFPGGTAQPGHTERSFALHHEGHPRCVPATALPGERQTPTPPPLVLSAMRFQSLGR